ncbi:t-SNARE [Phlyctochytrium arcticum]|nr:t-SNARE [Phlyctochytrium arcticum]
MPVDRFASLNNGATSSDHTVVEMQGLLNPGSGTEGLDAFFSEVELMKADIKLVRTNISEIERLQYARLLQTDNTENERKLEDVSETTKRLVSSLRSRVKSMMTDTDRMKPTRSAQIRRQHERGLANEIVKVAAEYQQMVQLVKQQHRDRLARQYRIVRPGATDEEVSDVVEKGGSIFSQEIISQQVGQQRKVLEEVETRHVQIQQIESALMELFELMNEMGLLLEQHQEIINIIEEHVETTNTNITAANKELTSAVVSAKSTRRTKWIISGILAVILLIIIIIIVIVTRKATPPQAI